MSPSTIVCDSDTYYFIIAVELSLVILNESNCIYVCYAVTPKALNRFTWFLYHIEL